MTYSLLPIAYCDDMGTQFCENFAVWKLIADGRTIGNFCRSCTRRRRNASEEGEGGIAAAASNG